MVYHHLIRLRGYCSVVKQTWPNHTLCTPTLFHRLISVALSSNKVREEERTFFFSSCHFREQNWFGSHSVSGLPLVIKNSQSRFGSASQLLNLSSRRHPRNIEGDIDKYERVYPALLKAFSSVLPTGSVLKGFVLFLVIILCIIILRTIIGLASTSGPYS